MRIERETAKPVAARSSSSQRTNSGHCVTRASKPHSLAAVGTPLFTATVLRCCCHHCCLLSIDTTLLSTTFRETVASPPSWEFPPDVPSRRRTTC